MKTKKKKKGFFALGNKGSFTLQKGGKLSKVNGLALLLASSLLLFAVVVLQKNSCEECGSLNTSLVQAKQKTNEAKKAKGELLVRFREGVSEEEQDAVIKEKEGKKLKEIKPIKVHLISVPEAAQEKVKEALSKNPKVEFVEDNYMAEAVAVPNDPSYGSQWHHPNISAPAGWDLNTGSESVIIAITDTGVDPTHPDLAAKLVPGFNVVNNTTDTHDIKGHGTAVAGSAAAIGNNGVGVAGVSWNSKIMPLMISGPDGWAYYSDMAEAMTWAADHGARVINTSFGGTASSSTLQSAADYAWNKGAILFASASNEGNNVPHYPAALNHEIAVVATNSANAKASFSCYGDWVDVSAPGEGILTTSNGGGYGGWSGTSFSSPITAGLAALIISANPQLTNTQVEQIIKNTADDLGDPGFDQYFGFGKINVLKALQAAGSTSPIVDRTAPTVSVTAPANGATVTGSATLTANANDDTGVTKVEFYVNGTLIGSDTTAPYSYYWNAVSLAGTNPVITAAAYDAAGNKGTSAAVTVTVISDISAPTVSISSPQNGAVVSGTVSINANAQDSSGVASLSCSVDGKVISSASNTSYISCSWNTKRVTAGAHTITVEAKDASGNIGQQTISVTVAGSTPPGKRK